ncbi:MAG TPA: BamA/TamA family outer membrane protein, partial [Sphingomicrobium sp.]|nr:BamA/TamA family outer membrane protein [Sphingomicrobium sp.]
SFSRTNDGDRNTTYSQLSTGAAVRLGFPITEFISLGARYQLVQDDLTLDEGSFFTDDDADPLTPPTCDPLLAGRYLCDQLGTTLSSVIGYSAIFDNRNGIRATRGQRIVLSQDFAGLGGDVKYARTRIDATKYLKLPKDFLLSVHGEAGYIHPLQSDPGPGRDAIRLSDRFFGTQMRGFDIRGIGPRVERVPYGDLLGNLSEEADTVSDAIGGRAYYMGRIELEIPVSANIRSLGLRPSAFIDIGSVFGVKRPNLENVVVACSPNRADLPTVLRRPTDTPFTFNCPADIAEPGGPEAQIVDYTALPGFREFFLGNSPKPRLSIGVGVNWVSPFGPLRIDVAKALLKQEGDETKLFSFNVGTQF